uniref:Uncharacterized protein n=1 Tax=Salix viminalis TaxID=40686 RepID=A0A6N2M0S2_SALVM
MQNWGKGKCALNSIVAEFDTRVIEHGSVGGIPVRFSPDYLLHPFKGSPLPCRSHLRDELQSISLMVDLPMSPIEFLNELAIYVIPSKIRSGFMTILTLLSSGGNCSHHHLPSNPWPSKIYLLARKLERQSHLEPHFEAAGFCVVLPDNKEAAELFNNIIDENLSCLLRVTNTLAARMPCQTKSMLASGNGNLFQSKSDALLPEMRQSAKESF